MNQVNKYHTNVCERIIDIMYLLYEADGISVNEISSKYKVAPTIVLEDLKYLSESEELDFLIFPCDEELDTDSFLSELFNGKHNDVVLYAEKMDDNYMFSLQLSAFEKIFLNAFLKEYSWSEKFNDTNDILIKNAPSNASWAELQIISQINEAIRNNSAVALEYKLDKCERKEIIPIKIVKMISTGICYCMAQNINDFEYIRLDDVEKIEILSECKFPLIDDKLKHELTLFEYRWGMEENDEPFDFAMIVYNEANLPGRLYRELMHRKYGKWAKNADRSYLYKDIVIDYQSLKQWVMELGSSVKVLEPKKLRDEILEDAYDRLAIYNTIKP